MRTTNSVDWNLLLETDNDVTNLLSGWSTREIATRDVVNRLAYTDFAGEFRRLVRNNGTTYARRLARKALRYRGVSV